MVTDRIFSTLQELELSNNCILQALTRHVKSILWKEKHTNGLIEPDKRTVDNYPIPAVSVGRSSRVLLQKQEASSFDPSQTAPTLSDQDIQSLKTQGFTMGLIRAMQYNTTVFPMRIWVVDNSGASKFEGFQHGVSVPHSNNRKNGALSWLTKSSLYIL